MKSIAALMMLVRSNVDLLSESEIKQLIEVLQNELTDRQKDKGNEADDEV